MIQERILDDELIKDLERRLGVYPLLEWLDDEANKLAQLGFKAGEGVEFSDALLSARGITSKKEGNATIVGEHASIRPSPRGYVIWYRNDIPVKRQRFSIAHEVGHTYWFKRQEPGKPLSPFQNNSSGAATIEALCDFFAGALLLPRLQLRQICDSENSSNVPPLHLISAIAREFGVADQAVARRLLYQIRSESMAIVKIRREVTNTRREERFSWRVSWCAVPVEIRCAHELSGLCVPMLTSQRTIPKEMVPYPQGSKTESCQIDGRWIEGLSAQSRKESRVPFKNRGAKATIDAYVATASDNNNLSLFDAADCPSTLYIAIPIK